jgi:hypothetical protein
MAVVMMMMMMMMMIPIRFKDDVTLYLHSDDTYDSLITIGSSSSWCWRNNRSTSFFFLNTNFSNINPPLYDWYNDDDDDDDGDGDRGDSGDSGDDFDDVFDCNDGDCDDDDGDDGDDDRDIYLLW